MFKKIVALLRPKTPPAFVTVLEKVGGGLHKRTDENRELLELLQEKAAPLLEEFPWIPGWLESNDDFFVALDALEVAANPQFKKGSGFPRPWPGPQPIKFDFAPKDNGHTSKPKHIMINSDFNVGEHL